MKYALNRAGISSRDYLIAPVGMPADGDDQLRLVELADESWICFYSERGVRKRLNTFQNAFDALDFFYWKLTRAPKFSSYRAEWERSTAGC